MKKILTVILLLLLTGCSLFKQEKTDATKFKEEYESLNNEELEIKIDNDNPIIYSTYDEIINIIKNKTAIIYFGFPECPWCRNAVPVLFEATKEMGINEIYYFNALSIRDKKSLDENNNIIIEQEGANEYKELVKLLYDYLPVYKGLNDDTIKRLYFPTVLFVKDGAIVGLHTATVDSQTDPSIVLNNEQHEELKLIYTNYVNKTYDIVCDDEC